MSPLNFEAKGEKNQALKNVIHDITATPIFLIDNCPVILSQSKAIFELPRQNTMSLSLC